MARTLIGKMLREQRKRDATDPAVAYLGGTTDRPVRYCYGCGPKHLDVAAPVRLRDFVAMGAPNAPCDECGELMLRS